MAIRERPSGRVSFTLLGTNSWATLANNALSYVSDFVDNDVGSGVPQNRGMVVVTATWPAGIGVGPTIEFYCLPQTADIGIEGAVGNGPPGFLIGSVPYPANLSGGAIQICSPPFDLPFGGLHIRVINKSGAAFPATVTAKLETWTPTRVDD